MSSLAFRVFLSAASSEFEAARAEIASDLRSRGILVKFQQDFRQEAEADTTLRKLHDYIRDCSAVISLVGNRSGSLPPADAVEPFADVLPDGIDRASYTQWEVLLALHHRKRLSIYQANEYYVPDRPETEASDALKLQERFVTYLFKQKGLDRSGFSTIDELGRLVLREDWPKARPTDEADAADMPDATTLEIRLNAPIEGKYPTRLTVKREGAADLEAEVRIEFLLTPQEQEDLRWYLEDYLQRADSVEPERVRQVETLMKERGEELYAKVLAARPNTQAIWFAVRERLADLRVEIASTIAEAASIPWELLRDPEANTPIALRVKSFVRVPSDPNISFVPVPPTKDGRVRLLYVVCRPQGINDVSLRAVANRLLHDLGEDLTRYQITALRPPTFEQLQSELTDAREAGEPYHIVHFDGHGIYADLNKSQLPAWADALSSIKLGGESSGKHGYVLFEHPGDENIRPVAGDALGQLLHDTGVAVLVVNACQSAMHEATSTPQPSGTTHDEVRAIGSLVQAVVDQGIPAVLGMRYSSPVVPLNSCKIATYAGSRAATEAKPLSRGRP